MFVEFDIPENCLKIAPISPTATFNELKNAEKLYCAMIDGPKTRPFCAPTEADLYRRIASNLLDDDDSLSDEIILKNYVERKTRELDLYLKTIDNPLIAAAKDGTLCDTLWINILKDGDNDIIVLTANIGEPSSL